MGAHLTSTLCWDMESALNNFWEPPFKYRVSVRPTFWMSTAEVSALAIWGPRSREFSCISGLDSSVINYSNWRSDDDGATLCPTISLCDVINSSIHGIERIILRKGHHTVYRKTPRHVVQQKVANVCRHAFYAYRLHNEDCETRLTFEGQHWGNYP